MLRIISVELSAGLSSIARSVLTCPGEADEVAVASSDEEIVIASEDELTSIAALLGSDETAKKTALVTTGVAAIGEDRVTDLGETALPAAAFAGGYLLVELGDREVGR